MWLVVFVFRQDRRPEECVVLFFPVIIFSNRNWWIRILTRQTVIWDLFQPWVRRLYLFLFRSYFFRWFKKHSRPDNCTFFFRVVIFSGRNWCSYFDTSTIYGTYIRSDKITTRKKVQLSGRPCFLAGSNYNWKKLRPKKKGTVVWLTVEIHVFWQVQITTGKNYDPKKKGTIVWLTVEINLR